MLGHAPLWNHEAFRHSTEALLEDRQSLIDQRPLGIATETAMPRSVVVEPVRQDGPAAMIFDRRDDARVVLADLRVQADRQRYVERVEQVEEAPDVDAIPVVAPRPIRDSG